MADDIWTSALKCTLYREGRHLHPSFLSTLCTWMNGWMDGFVSWPSRFRSTWRVAWLIAGRKQSYSGLLLSQHFCDFEVIQEKYKVMNESLLFAKAIETQWFVKTKTPGFISIKKSLYEPFPPPKSVQITVQQQGGWGVGCEWSKHPILGNNHSLSYSTGWQHWLSKILFATEPCWQSCRTAVLPHYPSLFYLTTS